MANVIFVHGMFQNPKSWDKWIGYFARYGHNCLAPAWPLHEGEPMALRDNPPPGLGDLRLKDIVACIEQEAGRWPNSVMIGHSVGGLITQIMLRRGLIATGVAIDSVAPNAMMDLDWGFLKNSAIIANPFKGDEPVWMDAKTFYSAFANTLSEEDAARAFEATAVHDSRNVLRDCMGPDGRIDLDAPHKPLLLIGGEMDEIIPAHLTEKNWKGYTDSRSVTEYISFAGRSHYICNEPGWEEVAEAGLRFVERHVSSSTRLL